MTTTNTPARRGASTPQPNRRFAAWPLDRDDTARIGLSAIGLLVVVSLVGLTIRHVLDSTALQRTDVAISEWFAAQRTPLLNTLSDYGSAFSDTITVVLALLVTVPLLIVITKRWNDSLLLVGAVGMETLIFVSTALLVGRDRPPVEQLDVSPPTASFPSGHTGAAVALYLALVVIVFWWSKNRTIRTVATVLGASIPVIVALSRLYRGMHFATDVVFGAVVGLVSVYVMATVLAPRSRADQSDEHYALERAG